ncbi:site-specific integrase [Brevibacillus sp. MS2.2]|uniref:site-specific integrase n=1 Tax=Brevibacillus sp. MS2.2 TaxID=2738981 RepID=UPI00156BD3F6|nr:site-specific integrase [Brevibacillus sp. MS2.2]NRR22797.1 site-specific integrase [Brevibacillus sp. MS2.2]
MKVQEPKQVSELFINSIAEHLRDLRDKNGISLWQQVHQKNINYFNKNCIGYPWTNHLALVMLVRALNNQDPHSIKCTQVSLHSRFKDLFAYFDLTTMEQWEPDRHMYEYLKKIVLPEHTDHQRYRFFVNYHASLILENQWFTTKLSEQQKTNIKPFLLPITLINKEEFSFSRTIIEKQQAWRKNETDAIVPHYVKIRAEAHLRWNRLNRLRNKYREVVNKITSKTSLPIEFWYDDIDTNLEHQNGERFYFRLWDRSSFVLAHPENYSSDTLGHAKRRTSSYAKEEFFLEFIKAEDVKTGSSVGCEGFWFSDLLCYKVIGKWYAGCPDEEKDIKKQFLLQWGYGDEHNKELYPAPFDAEIGGLLKQGQFVTMNQENAEGVLINVEPLYAAATFGVAAVDILTTTGARANELLQISSTKECIVVANDTSLVPPLKRYILRVVPKGRDTLENYYVSEETIKLLSKIKSLLREHYQQEKIPCVKYRDQRDHLFDSKPYFFQYKHKHFNKKIINICVRFLLHGIVMKTPEGKQVTLKSHLLRHAFATHAVQVEKLPIDVVGALLHQKNLRVTEYYSEPTPSMISQHVHDWLSVTATHLNVSEAILRAPTELQETIKELSTKAGTLTQVTGGICSIDALCPIKFACVGCSAKVPVPEKKNEIEDMKSWAIESKAFFDKKGQILESRKLNEVIRNCNKELQEIESIVGYRKDEKYDPEVRIRTPLASKKLF